LPIHTVYVITSMTVRANSVYTKFVINLAVTALIFCNNYLKVGDG